MAGRHVLARMGAILSLSLPTLSGCVPPAAPAVGAVRSEGVVVRTTQDTFPLLVRGRGRGAIITVTIFNGSRQPVWVVACSGWQSAMLRLDKWTGQEWTPAFSPVCNLEGAVGSRLRPGESHRDSAVAVGWAGASPDYSVAEITGTYRAIYHIQDHDPAGHLPPAGFLPVTARTSNRFVIAAPSP